jgi:dTDP-4-dehydrorhamnose 3,5-epimerase
MGVAFEPVESMPGLVVVVPKVHQDARGWFAETYKRSAFAAAGIDAAFVQDNHAMSAQTGVLRGLHFQDVPHAQGKLVRCVRGEVFDVAVDIRKGSPTYGTWHAERLSDSNRRMLWVPPGFAHGYCTLAAATEIEYKVTAEYTPEAERAVRWDDPAINIRWPVAEPTVSPRDALAPPLAEVEHGFRWQE